MSLLQSLFDKKKQPADLPPDSPALMGALKAFDKYGREIQINLSSRLVLLRTLAALKKIDAPLTASLQEKVEALMQEHPLEEKAQAAIIEELNKMLVA